MNAIYSKMRRRLLPALLVAALAALPAGARAQGVPGKVIRSNQQEQAGNVRWVASQKGYEVTANGVRVPLALNQVASVVVAPPADLARAVKAGDLDALGRIVDSYLMLGPDLEAMRAIADSYIKSGKGPQALDRFNRVMENRTPDKVPADVARAYWTVLLEAERYSELRTQLTAAIEKGPRPQAAAAQLLRGEMDMRRKQYRDALVDGFLRTIFLFGDVKDVQPEALTKAAKCFDELGESQNAEKMRRKLAQEYPGQS